jgi:soluble lytic murein transglycosylase-like protein
MMRAAYPATSARVSATLRAPASLVFAAVVALLAATPNASFAGNGFYRYEDSRGVVHFTNVQWDRRYTKLRELPKLQLIPSQRGGTRFRPARDARVYDPLVARVGREEGVPPALVKAVIHAESAFNPRAVSHKGAMGLMQLMPRTARYLGVQQPFVPEHNVEGGARYLRRLRERFGNWTMALAAYNAGPEAVSRFGGVPPYRETQTYVRRVLTYYRAYHSQFAAR